VRACMCVRESVCKCVCIGVGRGRGSVYSGAEICSDHCVRVCTCERAYKHGVCVYACTSAFVSVQVVCACVHE
jgi:hypothetical protein